MGNGSTNPLLSLIVLLFEPLPAPVPEGASFMWRLQRASIAGPLIFISSTSVPDDNKEKSASEKMKAPLLA